MARRGAVIASLLCLVGPRAGAREAVEKVWFRVEIPRSRYALEVWYKGEKIRLAAEEIMAALRPAAR